MFINYINLNNNRIQRKKFNNNLHNLKNLIINKVKYTNFMMNFKKNQQK